VREEQEEGDFLAQTLRKVRDEEKEAGDFVAQTLWKVEEEDGDFKA
jgi:hypothetical protein